MAYGETLGKRNSFILPKIFWAEDKLSHNVAAFQIFCEAHGCKFVHVCTLKELPTQSGYSTERTNNGTWYQVVLRPIFSFDQTWWTKFLPEYVFKVRPKNLYAQCNAYYALVHFSWDKLSMWSGPNPWWWVCHWVNQPHRYHGKNTPKNIYCF